MQTGKSMFVSNAWKSLVNSDSASHKSWHTSGLIFVASSTAKNLQAKSAKCQKWVGGRERNGRFYLIIKAVSPKAEKKQFSCLFPHTKKILIILMTSKIRNLYCKKTSSSIASHIWLWSFSASFWSLQNICKASRGRERKKKKQQVHHP